MEAAIRWRDWLAVVGLALTVSGAQCGHDGASDQSSEESASSEAPVRESPEGEGTEGAGSEEDRSAEGSAREEGEVRRADVERIENAGVDRSALEKLVRDNTGFGLSLYSELRGDRSGQNLVFAPYNLSQVLAMVLPGAGGATASEMREALQFRLADSKLHGAFSMLDSALQSRKSGGSRKPRGEEDDEPSDVLRTANALWAQEKLSLQEPFLETLAKYYGTGVHSVDFEDAPQRAREEVNQWAADRTNDKIRDLLPSGSVDERTRLILTAAVYFRGRWEAAFDEERTEEREFTSLSGETSAVPMMRQELRRGYRYASGSKYVAVELPYVSGAYSMVVIVPDEGAFGEVESNLDAGFVQSVFEDLQGASVDLSLPKFELSTQFSAASALRKLGMKTAFQNSADFSGMTEETDLAVDDILHEAYVSVDEEGTEAAAASAAAMRTTSLSPSDPEWRTVTVDRPFLFALRHTGTDTVLFLGRVVSI